MFYGSRRLEATDCGGRGRGSSGGTIACGLQAKQMAVSGLKSSGRLVLQSYIQNAAAGRLLPPL
jgi:hypothetical protein